MPKDTYLKWKVEGSLEDKLKTIKEMIAKKITQKDIAEVLGISERVLIKLKKEHSDVMNAFIFGNQELKDTLVNAIYERAVGVTREDVTTTIEEIANGKKKKISRTIRKYPPDANAARYLLITKFGREHNEKREEIDLMYKKQEDKNEKWS